MNQSVRQYRGNHYIADCFGCPVRRLRSMTVTSLRRTVSNMIVRHGLHELGRVYHRFGPGAYSGLVSLVESHLSFHTWPEDRYVSVDVFVCNYHHDAGREAKALFTELTAMFRPTRTVIRHLKR